MTHSHSKTQKLYRTMRAEVSQRQPEFQTMPAEKQRLILHTMLRTEAIKELSSLTNLPDGESAR